MSILTGDAIVAAYRAGNLVIDPFDESRVGPNSYDVTLSSELRVYSGLTLDMKKDNDSVLFVIPDEGLILYPGGLYLGSTVERVGSDHYVTYLDGRSSVGRLGIQIHCTAGRGDLAFTGRWTLEILVAKPVRVYAGVKIGQATFHTVEGTRSRLYKGKYVPIEGAVPSRMWQDFSK